MHMGMTIEEYAMEQVYEDLHHKAVLHQATLDQCIYVFVEGESEEVAFPILLERAGVKLKKDGIFISSYNGINNLPHVLRLMGQTLSYDRPIIITYDNDLDGQRISRKISQYTVNSNHIALLTIPSHNIVTYKNGHQGGSFEEAFDPVHFINVCFTKAFMPQHIAVQKQQFLIDFDVNKPWLSQVCEFCKINGYMDFGSCKVKLAEKLALSCPTLPSSFTDLASLIVKTRKDNPIKHPDDVDLPRISGITCK
ncbi:hypothetical protein C9J52_19130 [Photobacterium iliopiscarium]|uniref:OLD protein-like TOPRIM domain-containing protein n=2 Tax=Photobacterium iliopiscarium TaxID=56192 RepID=A0ABX5GMN7_9GAMM|nr:hypothetical protein C9J52_19130 [Photobacterium iliopiscarium]